MGKIKGLEHNQYYDKYVKDNYDKFNLKIRKEKHIKERLNKMSIEYNKSVNAMIIEAIESYLRELENM